MHNLMFYIFLSGKNYFNGDSTGPCLALKLLKKLSICLADSAPFCLILIIPHKI